MKKSFSIAFGLAVAISFWGIQSVSPIFQAIPVTGADSTGVRAGASIHTSSAMIQSILTPPYPIPTTTPAQPYPTTPMGPVAAAGGQISLAQLIEAVSGNPPDRVAGVFVPGKLSLPVLQQPTGNSNYVSNLDRVVTQYSASSPFGTIGLLAHNTLSGKKFFDLQKGDGVIIVYGNGRTEQYRVNQIERFQALSPDDIFSDFIDLSGANRTRLSYSQIFQRIFTKGSQVIFQTCIEANGNPSWGRIFIIAEKVTG